MKLNNLIISCRTTCLDLERPSRQDSLMQEDFASEFNSWSTQKQSKFRKISIEISIWEPLTWVRWTCVISAPTHM